MSIRRLRQPQYLSHAPKKPQQVFDPFQIPHYGANAAPAQLYHKLLEGWDCVLFNAHEIRIFKPSLLQSANLLDNYPQTPVRHMQVYAELSLLKEDAETAFLEGLLLMESPPFQVSKRDWMAGMEFFPVEDGTLRFHSPMIPLFRLGRVPMQQRLVAALASIRDANAPD